MPSAGAYGKTANACVWLQHASPHVEMELNLVLAELMLGRQERLPERRDKRLGVVLAPDGIDPDP